MHDKTSHRESLGSLVVLLAGVGLLTTQAAAITTTSQAPSNLPSSRTYEAPNPNPDAWGKVPTYGFRLDKPFPGTWDDDDNNTKMHGWTLELNMTRNIRGTRNSEPSNITLITAELIPPNPPGPGSLFDAETGLWDVNDTEVTDSWIVTMLTAGLDDTAVLSERNNQEDGSCPEGLFSEQCVEELQENIANDPRVAAGIGGPRGFWPDGDGSCGRMSVGVSNGISMNENFTRTATALWEVDVDDYNVYGVRTFPFIFVWGHSNTTNEAGSPLKKNHVTIACVKVDTVAEGSEFPTGLESGSAGLRVSATRWNWVVWATVVVGLFGMDFLC